MATVAPRKSEIASDIAYLDPDVILGGTQAQDSVEQIMAYQEAGYQPQLAFFTKGPSIPDVFREQLNAFMIYRAPWIYVVIK